MFVQGPEARTPSTASTSALAWRPRARRPRRRRHARRRVRRSINCDLTFRVALAGDLDLVVGNGMASSTTWRTPGRLRRRCSCWKGPEALNPFDGIDVGDDDSKPLRSETRQRRHAHDRVRRSINCDRTFCVARRRPGPRRGRMRMATQLHREHRDVYGAGVCATRTEARTPSTASTSATTAPPRSEISTTTARSATRPSIDKL